MTQENLETKIERSIEAGEIVYELNQLGGDIVLDLSNCRSLLEELDSFIASTDSALIPIKAHEEINREIPILNLFSDRLCAMINCKKKSDKYRFKFLGQNTYFS
ncbi:MAG: hypothetical protein VX100_02355 [Pseudomonadota bacterium]|nr:hypothetical protein [Pseudomonadota bacterium]